MASYSAWFDQLGLRSWCDAGGVSDPVSMQDLINLNRGNTARSWWDIPFPSLDNLHSACRAIGSTRDMTTGIENGFLAIKEQILQELQTQGTQQSSTRRLRVAAL